MNSSDTIRVVGLSGGSNPTLPLPFWMTGYRLPAGPGMFHDSAAVLMRDGRVLAAVEEERINRLKHTERLAVGSIRTCLRLAGLSAGDIDWFAYYGAEDGLDKAVVHHMLQNPGVPPKWSARTYFADALSHGLETEIDPARLFFVDHHHAHALSAYAVGPWDDALVVTLDGQGDGLSGSVWVGEHRELRRVLDIPAAQSLGFLYYYTLGYLGYGLFDEYKVMGLAAYGNPAPFREVFDAVCVLEADGLFRIDCDALDPLRTLLPHPRRAGDPIEAAHGDVAAALQEAVERAAFHLLRHYRASTGLRHLCLAGGVAHNSTLVGKIASSRLFDGVFTQPAAHDAGCALGAALAVQRQFRPRLEIERLSHVYWGADVGDAASIEDQLDAWSALIEVERPADVARDAARLIADGAVVGWVEGRSEFGPRALGNRSILADPRPEGNLARINALVKMREGYRPLAPAVLEEWADDMFEIPDGCCVAFMTATVPVRAEWRARLAAVVHVDGTSRIQAVSRRTNQRFWALIDAFRIQTGVPALLNTSFNHSVEPIVDSIDDAVTCFLTTGLTHLVVGDFVVTRRALDGQRVLHLVPVIPQHVRVVRSVERDCGRQVVVRCRCEHTVLPSRSQDITEQTYRMVDGARGQRPLRSVMPRGMPSAEKAAIAAEFERLWSERLINMLPSAVAARP
jgi:carbamoyltransferase